MIANKNYESDIRYTVQINRFICRMLGIWPQLDTKPSLFETLRNFLLILVCYFLLLSELIPTVLYVILIEKRTRIRLKLISSLLFTILAVLKYTNLVFTRSQVKRCLVRVQADWRDVANAASRDFMLERAKTARRLIILCAIFMYISGVYFRTVVPLSKGKIVTPQNVTMRFLACPSYFVFFDGRISPAYEIMFFIQFMSGFMKYTITVAICSLAALFAMHTCAYLDILMSLLNNLVNERDEKNLDKRLAMTVDCQMNMKSFLQLVQDSLEFPSLMEVMGCTIIVCLLGHDIITEWEDQNVVAMFSYLVLLTSIGFNIFIFCYIGEQLSVEGEKISIRAITLDWHRLPYVKAKSLILIIAMSNIPTKLRAGKFFDLSIRTFGDVVKTAVTYLNFLRQLME